MSPIRELVRRSTVGPLNGVFVLGSRDLVAFESSQGEERPRQLELCPIYSEAGTNRKALEDEPPALTMVPVPAPTVVPVALAPAPTVVPVALAPAPTIGPVPVAPGPTMVPVSVAPAKTMVPVALAPVTTTAPLDQAHGDPDARCGRGNGIPTQVLPPVVLPVGIDVVDATTHGIQEVLSGIGAGDASLGTSTTNNRTTTVVTNNFGDCIAELKDSAETSFLMRSAFRVMRDLSKGSTSIEFVMKPIQMHSFTIVVKDSNGKEMSFPGKGETKGESIKDCFNYVDKLFTKED